MRSISFTNLLTMDQVSHTLGLVNDYFRFVTGFFEVISTSAPHIYHSALLLSPKTSSVRRLYERYAHPLTRIVQGIPTSWDPIIATTKWSHPILRPVWSPCGRFIAIRGSTTGMGTHILDAVTHKQLKLFARQEGSTQLFTFSTGSRLLTWLGRDSLGFLSWDIRTGILFSIILLGEGRSPRDARSITYSGCGNMFGVLFKSRTDTVIDVYSVLPDEDSDEPIYSHTVEGPVTDTIWTHGECIRFATLEPRSVTVWEVGFTSEHPAAKVESVQTPNDFDPWREFVFLPTPFRLAFVLGRAVIVWDAQRSEVLLNFVGGREPRKMTFSPNGRFFACGTDGPEVYLWKESPTGYILHLTLISNSGHHSRPREPLISPDGQSIIVSHGPVLQSWSTADSSVLPSGVHPTQTSRPPQRFILGFSPDESLAATGRLANDTVTVLDLKSGALRLVIDAGMKIRGLRVAENTIVVVGDGTIVTWPLPLGDGVLNLTVNESVRKITFDHPTPLEFSPTPAASISPDFNQIAVVDAAAGLRIYDVSTGKRLAGVESRGDMPWLALEGHEVWCCSTAGKWEGWAIVKYRGFDVTKLERLDPAGGPPGGFPWQSPRGYKITGDGWILGTSGKQLLWLPPHWRSGETDMAWSGRFLALLHPELPEAVVMELLQE